LSSGEERAVKLEYYKIDLSLLRDEYEIYESLAGGKGILKDLTDLKEKANIEL